MSKNILFTGGTGFIGRSVIPYLGCKVFAPTRKELNLFDVGEIDRYLVDHKIDMIIHAASVGATKAKKDQEIYINNITMFDNLFRFREIEYFINIDSGAIFDKRENIEYYTTPDAYSFFPKDDYGRSKKYIALDVYQSSRAINMRLYGCFGPLQDKNRFIASCFRKALLGSDILVSDMYMDYFYIGDVIIVLNRYIEKQPTEDIDLVYSDSGSINLIDIAKEIYAMVGRGGRVIRYDYGKTYCGNPIFLNSLNIDLLGRSKGFNDCYEYYLRKWMF